MSKKISTLIAALLVAAFALSACGSMPIEGTDPDATEDGTIVNPAGHAPPGQNKDTESNTLPGGMTETEDGTIVNPAGHAPPGQNK